MQISGPAVLPSLGTRQRRRDERAAGDASQVAAHLSLGLPAGPAVGEMCLNRAALGLRTFLGYVATQEIGLHLLAALAALDSLEGVSTRALARWMAPQTAWASRKQFQPDIGLPAIVWADSGSGRLTAPQGLAQRSHA